jgi:hypothetical protein
VFGEVIVVRSGPCRKIHNPEKRRISVSARKPSKTRQAKTSVGGRPAAKIALSERGERTPLGYLFDLMNDETVPDRQRDAIAVKLAPYFHAKLKRAPARALPDTVIPNEPTDPEDAGSDADQREGLRKRIFRQLD